MHNNSVNICMVVPKLMNKVVDCSFFKPSKTHHRWRRLASAFWSQGNRGLQIPEHQPVQSSSSCHDTSLTPSSRLTETSTLAGNKHLSIISLNKWLFFKIYDDLLFYFVQRKKGFEHIIWCLYCCSKTFPLDGRSVLFQSQTYVWFCFSLLRALKAVMLQVAKRGWIDGQNRVILTGQLHSLILTHRSRTVMLCGEENSLAMWKTRYFESDWKDSQIQVYIWLFCSYWSDYFRSLSIRSKFIRIKLSWLRCLQAFLIQRAINMIIWMHVNVDVLFGYKILLKHKYSYLTRLALVGDNDVFAGFRAGILTKHRTHHRNLTLPSILALRHHFLNIKNHTFWFKFINYYEFSGIKKMSKSRSKIPEWLWLMYSLCFPLLCLGLRVGTDMDSEHGVHKMLREQPQMFWWGTWWTASLHHTHGQCGSSGSCGGNLRGKYMQTSLADKTSVECHCCRDKGLSLLSVQTRHCECI